jgi:hypothetical protein
MLFKGNVGGTNAQGIIKLEAQSNRCKGLRSDAVNCQREKWKFNH